MRYLYGAVAGVFLGWAASEFLLAGYARRYAKLFNFKA